MRTNRYLSAAMLTFAVMAATPACAAYSQYGGYGNPNGSYREMERRAYDRGYRDGVRLGENDARRGRTYSYSNHTEYRDADEGWRRTDGDREFYRRTFRQGFQTGYSESYNRYSGYGNNYPSGNTYPTYPTYPGNPSYPSGPGGVAVPRGGYGSPALDTGYRDGFEAGRSDARSRERYDPVRAKRYREGDHDYNSRYGTRDEYKREYRTAFERGYREGYASR